MYTVRIETQVLHIGCVADEAYAPGLAVTIRSALERAEGKFVHVWLLNGGVTSHTKRKLEQSWAGFSITVTWLTADLSVLIDLPVYKGNTFMSYAKLLLANLVSADRFLYLDTDTLVRADLSALWQLDFSSKAFAAVQDVGCMTLGDPINGLQMIEELQLDPAQPFFNAGVLCIETQRWRELNITERVLAFSQKYATRVRWVEQDGLNAIGHNDWFHLDPVWNSVIGAAGQLNWNIDHIPAEALKPFLAEPKIVHFIGPNKPWKPGCTHPFFQEYRTVSLRTRFPIV